MARRRLPWTRLKNWARALLTGRYVVASDAVRAEYGLTDTDNSDTQDIVDASDWRDDAWRAEGGH